MPFQLSTLYDAVHAALSQVIRSDGSLLSLNEAETRTHVIDPVIEALGYRTLDQVRREYRLPDSGQVVDYLLSAGEQKVVVEAKPLGVELGGREASQLVGYCAQEGVRWALLSNGLVWTAFDVEASGNWEKKRIADVDLLSAYRGDTLGEALAPLAHFALDALRSDDQFLIAWAHEERARMHLDRLLGDSTSPVIEAVVSEMARAGIDVEPDDVVSLLRRGTSGPTRGPEDAPVAPVAPSPTNGAANYYVFPAAPAGGHSAEEHFRHWLAAGFWGVRGSTPHRKRLMAGDGACFYAKKVGIIAQARIAGPATHEVNPDEWPGPDSHSPNVFRVPITDVLWQEPRTIDRSLRERLDAFRGRDLSRPWSWFIQSTNRLSEHDFKLLTTDKNIT